MKAAAYIVLIGILVLSVLFAVSVSTRSTQGQKQSLLSRILDPPNSLVKARFNGANSELRRIYAGVQNETSVQLTQGNSNAIERAVVTIVEIMGPLGYDYFRLAGGTNHVFVALNPETGFWLAPDSYTNEIAAYWPTKLRASKEGSPGFVAICFGGRNVFLTNAPTWTAIQLTVKNPTLTNGINPQ